MKKTSILFSFLLILFLGLFTQTTKVYAVIGADCSGHGKCGATTGGCAENEICIDATIWDLQGGKCEASNGRCENRDDSRAEICGYTYFTDGWCNASGGCADGHMCNSTTKVCEPSTGCEHIQNVYNRQCYKSVGTSNKCGTDGACEYGYRCTSVPTVVSKTGYACRPDPTSEANKCPGSPAQEAVTLSCGEAANNPNATCNCVAGNPDGTPHTLADGRRCCGWKVNGGADCGATDPTTPLLCGQTSASSTATCNCTGATLAKNPNVNATTERNQMYCCGWVNSKNCASTKPDTGGGGDDGTGGGDDGTGGGDDGTGGGDDTPTLDIFEGPNSEDFKLLNPIQNYSTEAESFTSPGGIISRILVFAFPIAGLILFVMLVLAGFQIIMGAASGGSKAMDSGKQRATNALIGFTLLFISYWVMQIIETIFGITIL